MVAPFETQTVDGEIKWSKGYYKTTWSDQTNFCFDSKIIVEKWRFGASIFLRKFLLKRLRKKDQSEFFHCWKFRMIWTFVYFLLNPFLYKCDEFVFLSKGLFQNMIKFSHVKKFLTSSTIGFALLFFLMKLLFNTFDSIDWQSFKVTDSGDWTNHFFQVE